MPRARPVVFAALLAAACSGGDAGYAVRLDSRLSDAISDDDVDRIRTMELEVGSAEVWYQRFDVGDRFGHRKARILYYPRIPAGSLTFTVLVRAGDGHLLGAGAASVVLRPGATVDANVEIVPPVMPDFGAPVDLGAPDLARPDLARPDLRMPPSPDMTLLDADLADAGIPDAAADLALPDLGAKPDLAHLPDLSSKPDLSSPADLASPADAPGDGM